MGNFWGGSLGFFWAVFWGLFFWCNFSGDFLDNFQSYSKAVTDLAPTFFLAAPKLVSFFTSGSCEKDTIFGAARIFFGPSYYVMALTNSELWIGVLSILFMNNLLYESDFQY